MHSVQSIQCPGTGYILVQYCSSVSGGVVVVGPPGVGGATVPGEAGREVFGAAVGGTVGATVVVGVAPGVKSGLVTVDRT